MPWPVHPTGFFGARGDQDTYRIERSLRFNSADSAYLNRTPASAGNRKTWTWSGWVKRSSLTTSQWLFGAGPVSTDYTIIRFGSGGSANDFLEYVRVVGTVIDAQKVSSAVYRDTSAWYHIVIAEDAANTVTRVYVNGSEISYSTNDNPSNVDGAVNNTGSHEIGRYVGITNSHFDGYLTEINFIDGQALTPSSFGETDAITGRWKAKAYSGTYGTNGFYLKFADNSGTTDTTLGKDSSPNGNNWTPNNFSVTAGAGNDSLLDSPTNNGTSGNYATLNPLNAAHTYSNGNLDVVLSTTGVTSIPSAVNSLGVSSGKWYFEFTPTVLNAGCLIGITAAPASNAYPGLNSSSYGYYSLDGNKFNSASGTAYGNSFTVNDIIGIAFDIDGGKIWFAKNGTWQASGNPESGTNAAFTSIASGTYFASMHKDTSGASTVSGTFNFGQRPFAYAAPTGFKALCTTNLPTPTIQKPSKYMDVVAYTGTGASNSISSLGFSPDLVWIKNRGGATDHALYDTTRGTQAQLSSNTTGSEVTSSTGLTAFGTNGFTIGTSSLVNTSGTQYVAWAWDEAPIAGMDIVAATMNTSGSTTINHNLGVTPKFVITKNRSGTIDWNIYSASLGVNQYILLNSTAAATTSTGFWGTPTSTQFVFSSAFQNTGTYIAYLFAEVEGFSKFGSYTGNGSSDGPFVWCGFRPRWIMIKGTNLTSSWILIDTARNTINNAPNYLLAESSISEGTDNGFDILSNGFKQRNSGSAQNSLGGTYIFAAFAESPFKYARAR